LVSFYTVQAQQSCGQRSRPTTSVWGKTKLNLRSMFWNCWLN